MALNTPRQMPKLCGNEVCCPSRDLWRVVCKDGGVIMGKERRKGGEVVIRGEELGPGPMPVPPKKD